MHRRRPKENPFTTSSSSSIIHAMLLPLLFLISHPLFAVSFPQPQSIELITPTGSPSDFSHHIPTDPVNRSPCPFTNALSNHALLPRTNITHNQVLNVLTTALKLSTPSALVFADQAMSVGEHGSADLWMMQRHGAIEHDASLTRDDAALGDAVDVNRTLYSQFRSISSSGTHITLPELLAFRSYRDRDSRLRNANFTYGPKEAFTAYGETALLFLVLREDAELSAMDERQRGMRVDWLDMLILEEKMPVELGWRAREVGFLETLELTGYMRGKTAGLV